MRILGKLLLTFSLLLPASSCTTIMGTAVSPITGGVDLVVQTLEPDDWPVWVPVFLGGAIAGPFVAFYNGVNRDADIFSSFDGYWIRFDDVFRPWEMIGVGK